MQTSISLKVNNGGSDFANLEELKALQADNWNVVIAQSPTGCLATLIVLEKEEPKEAAPAAEP